MPVIPTTVTNMFTAFENCASLKECSMPSSVENINWCWAGTGIEEVIEIPQNVVYMQGSFAKCNSLEYANVRILDKVTSLYSTFTQCQSLKEANLFLPEGFENFIIVKI